MTTRCYRSKIGRLPFAIRNELNERIRDGVGGPEILAWLNGLPSTRKIIRELKSGDINAQTLASAAGGNAAGVGCNIATAKIMDALESADEEQVADLAKALVQLRAGENAAQKVALAEEKNAIQKEQLELSRAKFERDTARLFVKWAQNKDALSIATDRKLGGDEKTERLGRLMFGDLWEGADDGK